MILRIVHSSIMLNKACLFVLHRRAPMDMYVSERRGQFYARVSRDGGIIQIGPDMGTKAEAISALILANPLLFGVHALIDTTQQMVPPPKQTPSS